MADVVSKDNYDFCGWVTKNNLRCSDGRTIRKNAFKVDDGEIKPLVWNHQHNSINDVLGHTLLENRDDGVFGYCLFNNTTNGKNAKEVVQHGDVKSLSIWANNLVQEAGDVIHGVIREVSLVLAGANPGAFIESVMAHGEPMGDFDDEGIIYTGEEIILSTGDPIVLSHAEEEKKEEKKSMDDKKKENSEKKEEPKGGKTVGDVYNTLTDEQKKMMAYVVSEAVKDAASGDSEKKDEPKEEKEKKGEDEMKHNIFEGKDDGQENVTVLSHSDVVELMKDGKRLGSLREAWNQKYGEEGVLAHSLDTTGMTAATGSQTYGINDMSMLFPDYKTLNTTPEFISRNMNWVGKVLTGVHRTPFSRVKSMFADITEDEARARGYIKGKEKKEEVFSTLKRTTDPQTIYKKQKMDRDDILDINGSFDVVAWIKGEMKMMLDEEKARAILIGDGRAADSDDKIKEDHIRPIVSDVSLFNVSVPVSVEYAATDEDVANITIDTVIRSRKDYKGSGNPTFFTTEDYLTEMLLLKDKIGHPIYKTEAELATALRVKEIVTVEPMAGYKVSRKVGSTTTQYPLIGVIVNLNDYNVGADRGADTENFFEDFDIDFNQQKYLLETRFSGALTKPFSAMTVYLDRAAKPASGGTGGNG